MEIYAHVVLILAFLAAFGTSTQIDKRIDDIIAENVLNFGHNVGKELAALDPNGAESKIFSPLSIMTALSLLALGAKGKSYQELKQVLGLDSDNELIQSPTKFHEEFGLMLNDLQHKIGTKNGVNNRGNANWRTTNLKRRPSRPSRFQGPVEHIIKIANGLFVQNDYSLNSDYREVLRSIYETKFTQLDFLQRNAEARDYINAWVEKETFGKIPKIIEDDISKSTKVILASTLYLKAFWQTQFFYESTREDDFYPDGKQNPSIKVQMMPTVGVFPFYDAKEYDCRILGLPYRDNETTMYIIQPNDSTRQKLKELQLNLNGRKINEMIDKMVRKSTTMLFPKMHFRRNINLKKILQTMNVNNIFANGYSDLSLIAQRSQSVDVPESAAIPSLQSIFRKKPVHESLQSSSSFLQDVASSALSNLESLRQKVDSFKSDLYVDDILHNVDFTVDEQGTEAAAATLTIVLKSGSDVIFLGNTPFLILIRHDPTKLPLFYGIINKPEL